MHGREALHVDVQLVRIERHVEERECAARIGDRVFLEAGDVVAELHGDAGHCGAAAGGDFSADDARVLREQSGGDCTKNEQRQRRA